MREASMHRCSHLAKAGRHRLDLPRYPIDMSSLLTSFGNPSGDVGVLDGLVLDDKNEPYHPLRIAQYALAHWNASLVGEGDGHREAFIAHACWLLAHQSHLSTDTSGWLIPYKSFAHDTPRYVVSALVQGSGISVLVRAYQMTGEDIYLAAARRAVRTFQLDILDGGVSTPIGEHGIFFEEIAVYPAMHSLRGYLLALFGLYDYVAVAEDCEITELITRSLAAFRLLVAEYDTGYWTYIDLGYKRLASPLHHSSHTLLLETLAAYVDCEYYATLAKRWKGYQRGGYYLRYLIAYHVTSHCGSALKRLLRRFVLPTHSTARQSTAQQICVPITAFPIAGGMRGVLAGVANVMKDQWQLTYVTNYKGAGAQGLAIEVFGRRGVTSPWQFPFVWFYCLAGGYHLFKMLRRTASFSIILPQDGIYTAAFAAFVGKMMGARVVCMDHGNIACLESTTLRREREQSAAAYSCFRRLITKLLLGCYWPSLRLLACVATLWIDHYLIAGDEVEEACRELLGIHPSRISRYAYVVDSERITPLEPGCRARIRATYGVPEGALLITLVNRLAQEKGLPVALEGIAQALAELPSGVRQCVRVLIAGDGPLRSQVEDGIAHYHLADVCRLCGEATPAEVANLLGSSDIFLYSGTRGTNYSMAVLEAMAAGCAVVASNAPQSNARLLAEERGIPVIAGDARGITSALQRLCADRALCKRMGMMAREYVLTYHSASMLKRTLLRASYFTPLCFEQELHTRTSLDAQPVMTDYNNTLPPPGKASG
jgi:glycosyltransferase involved in cell wall biosynthesis